MALSAKDGDVLPRREWEKMAPSIATMLGNAPQFQGAQHPTNNAATPGNTEASLLGRGLTAANYHPGQESGVFNPSLPHGDYMEAIYNKYLGRQSDPDGMSFWMNQLAQGGNMSQIARAIGASPEAQAHAQTSQGPQFGIPAFQGLNG